MEPFGSLKTHPVCGVSCHFRSAKRRHQTNTSARQRGSARRPDYRRKTSGSPGYESLWVWDRLLAPVNPKAFYPIGNGTHPAQFRSVLDPLEALTFVAGHTERIALGTSVLILPLYNPTSRLP